MSEAFSAQRTFKSSENSKDLGVCAFIKKYDLDVEECAEILADLAADRLIFKFSEHITPGNEQVGLHIRKFYRPDAVFYMIYSGLLVINPRLCSPVE